MKTRTPPVLLLALTLGFALGSTVHAALAQDEGKPCPPPVECPPCPTCAPTEPAGPTPEQVQAVQHALEAIQAAEVLEPPLKIEGPILPSVPPDPVAAPAP
jgi:hypothetical protein